MRLGFVGIIAVAVLALEMVGIYQIGLRIGVLGVLLWLAAAVVIGFWVIRQASTGFLPEMMMGVSQGRPPLGMLWATGRRFLAGALLVLPGAGSDVLAVLLLLWPGSRPQLRPGQRARKPDDGVIEGEYRRMDEP